jgi:hypothetical protein
MPTHIRMSRAILTVLVAACAPEATAPQGAAAVGRVVPIAVPDVWCPATAEGKPDTAAAKQRVKCPTPIKSDSEPSANAAVEWIKIQGQSVTSLADSAMAADTTK